MNFTYIWTKKLSFVTKEKLEKVKDQKKQNFEDCEFTHTKHKEEILILSRYTMFVCLLDYQCECLHCHLCTAYIVY